MRGPAIGVLGAVTLAAVLSAGAATAGQERPPFPADLETASVTQLGQAWSEPTIAYAYAFEQASQLRQAPSRVNPSLFRCVPPKARSCPP